METDKQSGEKEPEPGAWDQYGLRGVSECSSGFSCFYLCFLFTASVGYRKQCGDSHGTSGRAECTNGRE